MQDFTQKWIEKCYWGMRTTEADGFGQKMTLDQATYAVRIVARSFKRSGAKMILIGNGGSQTTAAHIAIDFGLAGIRATALNDAAMVTSHGNDFGFEAIYTKWLELHEAQSPDILIALSCSGRSPNILDAMKYARAHGMGVVTLTGFEPDNPMRIEGDVNFYTPSHEYGFVQMAQLGILHAIVDIENGWTP
jgi:D-sedoheptulose 7-phosphate isomerase